MSRFEPGLQNLVSEESRLLIEEALQTWGADAAAELAERLADEYRVRAAEIRAGLYTN